MSVDLVAGDFNLPIESAIYRQYWGDYTNAFSRSGIGTGRTKSTRLFGVRIDHILVGERAEPIRSWIGPALTRCLSFKQLSASCFLSGPSFLEKESVGLDFAVRIPDPRLDQRGAVSGVAECSMQSTVLAELPQWDNLVPVERYSSFRKLVAVRSGVRKFVNRLKQRLNEKFPGKHNFECIDDVEVYAFTLKQPIALEQRKFNDLELIFLKSGNEAKREIPPLITRFNLVVDDDGILRVRSKFARWNSKGNFKCQIFLPKDSKITEMIIRDAHGAMAHSGCYVLLTHLSECTARRSFASDRQ
jgi:hypothetical protein